MTQVKIKDEKILSDEHYVLKRIEFEIQKKSGEWETQKREVFDHGNAVTVLLYNKETRNLLFTKQFRIATYVNGNSDGMLLETPAGLLEENESPEEAMLREIKEETGYAVPSVQKIFEAYTSAGSLTERVYFYTAPYSKEQKVARGGGLEEEGEELDVIEMSLDKAVQMIESGEIVDAKTILLVQYAQLKNLV
ncbi:MAG: NUDIX domain-containing protein [Chitinophagaceae bacterium]|nr:MAG: NUDIX domain-containing protein [Chitinophagaceae bacterium]